MSSVHNYKNCCSLFIIIFWVSKGYNNKNNPKFIKYKTNFKSLYYLKKPNIYYTLAQRFISFNNLSKFWHRSRRTYVRNIVGGCVDCVIIIRMIITGWSFSDAQS
jgi:hypothetical protein